MSTRYGAEVYVDNQNVCRNGLALDAQSGKVFNALEKNGVQISNVQLEFQQISVDNPVVIVCKNIFYIQSGIDAG